ncbi:MAG: hypothetical protein J6Q76_02775 [Clostridia bacterium]|nr:hypothetical protein [Clostridia bacterium]
MVDELSVEESVELSVDESVDVSLDESEGVSLEASLEVSLDESEEASLEVSEEASLEVLLEALELASFEAVESVLEELLLPLEGVLLSVELEGLDDVSEELGLDESAEVDESELVLSALVLLEEAPSVSELVTPTGRSTIELF